MEMEMEIEMNVTALGKSFKIEPRKLPYEKLVPYGLNPRLQAQIDRRGGNPLTPDEIYDEIKPEEDTKLLRDKLFGSDTFATEHWIYVKERPDGNFDVVEGSRRWVVMRMIREDDRSRFRNVCCWVIVDDMPDDYLLAWMSNHQEGKKSWPAYAQAAQCFNLCKSGHTHKEIAEHTRFSKTTVGEKIAIYTLNFAYYTETKDESFENKFSVLSRVYEALTLPPDSDKKHTKLSFLKTKQKVLFEAVKDEWITGKESPRKFAAILRCPEAFEVIKNGISEPKFKRALRLALSKTPEMEGIIGDTIKYLKTLRKENTEVAKVLKDKKEKEPRKLFKDLRDEVQSICNMAGIK